MTTIKFIKSNWNYIGIEVQGHAPKKYGKLGHNIVCAAISVLAQTALKHLDNEKLISSFSIGDGFLEFKTVRTLFKQATINNSLKLIEVGLQDLQGQYPEAIKIVY